MTKASTIPYITEAGIEAAVIALNEEAGAFEQLVVEMEEQQPEVLGYFFAENFESFAQEEREYSLFLLLVIWRSLKDAGATVQEVSADDIEDAEDNNWAMVQDLPSKAFNDRLNVFFENYPQEDLLAFLEDALSPDDEGEDPVTKEGREALFIVLKSVVDCWCGWTQQ